MKNQYDEKFIFRKADKRDLQSIAAYFDNVWKRNGILSDAEFLEYEFAGKGEDINIILAVNKETNMIQGLWGYYPFSEEAGVLDVAGGPWSVRQDKECIPFLGNEIMNRAKEIIGYRTMLGIGDDKNTSGLYHRRFHKDVVGRLNHFYILNRMSKYKISKINKIPIDLEETEVDPHIHVSEIERIDEVSDEFWKNISKDEIPYKSKEYIIKRFIKHPIYQYKLIGIFDEDQLGAIFFMRRIAIEKSNVNRIVDYIGEKKYIAYVGEFLKKYMEDINCEYTDFYNYGFEKILMMRAGFHERLENDINVIPNYFEPFVQENIEIYFSSPTSKITLCKADGDQDRPNYIRRK